MNVYAELSCELDSRGRSRVTYEEANSPDFVDAELCR